MAPVFLGAEDHPPRDRRPKCLTGSAITLVRSARPNPRGRHARVADPSGVECQRDGSDQGQRMEAGDGALTQDRCPAPSQNAHRSPAVPPRWSQRINVVQTGKKNADLTPMNAVRCKPVALEHLGHVTTDYGSPTCSCFYRLNIVRVLCLPACLTWLRTRSRKREHSSTSWQKSQMRASSAQLAAHLGNITKTLE